MAVCVWAVQSEECSRRSCSLLVLADSRVILLPIGVMDTVPLGPEFPLFKMIRCPTIHVSNDVSRYTTRVCVCATSDPGEFLWDHFRLTLIHYPECKSCFNFIISSKTKLARLVGAGYQTLECFAGKSGFNQALHMSMVGSLQWKHIYIYKPAIASLLIYAICKTKRKGLFFLWSVWSCVQLFSQYLAKWSFYLSL